MDNLEYIETYFNEELSPERKKEFESRITGDPEFAEEVAFYLSLKQVATAEMKKEKEKFRQVYELYKKDKGTDKGRPTILRKLLPWVGAAALLAGIIFGWNVFLKPASPHVLAGKYILEHFQTLPVRMDNKQDSLQTALRLYNEGRQDEALRQFEGLVFNDTSFFEAKKYAGIVSLRLGKYDKAINYFSQIENYTQLYANPGKFYHALALLKRNRTGDKQEARILLEQVVQHDLEGRPTAQEWLKKW